MTGDFPCHWTHPHGRHPWTPILEDPFAPHVLHIDTTQPLTCPGRPTSMTTPVIAIDQLQLQRSDDPAGLTGSTDVRVGDALVSIGGGSHGWRYRVQLTPGQAIIGFGKFGTIGVGFEVEDYSGNTNLPYGAGLTAIADHIGGNRVRYAGGRGEPDLPTEDDVIPYATALEAIRLIRDAAGAELGFVCPRCTGAARNDPGVVKVDHFVEDCPRPVPTDDYFAKRAAEREARGRNDLGWLNPEPVEDDE